MNTPFRFTASVKADKARKLFIVGYTGGVMRVSGYGAVVLDLSTMEIPASVPVLADHDSSIGGVVGSATAKVVNGQLLFDASCADTEAAAEVLAILEGGVPLQASVGCDIGDKEYIRPGASIKANGRMVESEDGFTYWTGTRLREITICPLGADSNTSTSIAAKLAATKGRSMIKAMLLASGKYTAEEIDQMDEAQAKAALKAFMGMDEPDKKEPAKASTVVELLGSYGKEILAKAIDEQWTEDRCRSEAVEHLRASRPGPGVGAPSRRAPAGYGYDFNSPDNTDHISAGILIRAGYEKAAEKAYGPRTMEEARAGNFHKMSLSESLLAAARARGVDVSGGIESLMIRADGASSMAINDLLSNTQNKLLEIQWQQSPPTWTSWCASRGSKDFKPNKSLRPVFEGTMSPLNPSGEIQHANISDDLISWQLSAFAKMLTIPMPMIINDDVQGLMEAPMGLSMMAQRSLSDLIYAALMADTTIFPTNDSNGNYQSSGSSVLSVTSLGTAIKKLRLQTAPNGSPLNLQPKTLVVPPSLEQVARALLNSTFVFRDVSSTDLLPAGNTLQSICNLEVEPRLELGCTSPIAGSTFQTGSATRWFLFADQAALPAIVGGLGGTLIPQIQTASQDWNFNTWGVSMRAIASWGFTLGDYRASQKSAGA